MRRPCISRQLAQSLPVVVQLVLAILSGSLAMLGDSICAVRPPFSTPPRLFILLPCLLSLCQVSYSGRPVPLYLSEANISAPSTMPVQRVPTGVVRGAGDRHHHLRLQSSCREIWKVSPPPRWCQDHPLDPRWCQDHPLDPR